MVSSENITIKRSHTFFGKQSKFYFITLIASDRDLFIYFSPKLNIL